MRRANGAAAALALVIAAAAIAGAAAADSGTFRLSFVRGDNAASCFDERALTDRVTARLGRDPFSKDGRRSIEALILRDGRRWSARIFIRGADGAIAGERAIEDESDECHAIEDATTLAIALAIDPEAALRPPPTPPSQPTSVIVPPLQPPPVIASSPPLPLPLPLPTPADLAPTSTTSVGVVIRAVIAGGLLPRAAAGVDVGGVGRFDRVSVLAGLRWFPEVRTSDGNFGFTIVHALAGACVDAARSGTLVVGGCGQLAVGAISATPYVFVPVTPGQRWFGAAELGPRLGFGLGGPIRAELGLAAIVPFARYRFEVEGQVDPVFVEPSLAFAGSAGIGASIP